jgi:hypothetical protein
MKTINKSTLLAIAFMTISSMGFAQGPSAVESKAVDLKFIGNVDSQPIFSLTLNNNQSEKYLLTVRDENDEMLYSEVITGENISRKYKLDINQENLDYSLFKVTFEITSTKTHKTTIYNITKKMHVVEDISIAKL